MWLIWLNKYWILDISSRASDLLNERVIELLDIPFLIYNHTKCGHNPNNQDDNENYIELRLDHRKLWSRGNVCVWKKYLLEYCINSRSQNLICRYMLKKYSQSCFISLKKISLRLETFNRCLTMKMCFD